MTITRKINGGTVEIKLTDDELLAAYYEKQGQFDEEDVWDVFDDLDSDEIKETYGMTPESIVNMIPEIARQMRWNINNYAMTWENARDLAIEEILYDN